MAFSPGGGLLATANAIDDTVSVFSVGSGGALTPVAGSPFATGRFPVSVAFSPVGGLLATANELDNTVTVYGPSASALAAILVTASTGVGPGRALANKARAIQTAVNAGQTARACAAITGYLGLVKAQTNKKLTKAKAATLTTAANNLQAALGC